jgi:hypothetical protein
MVPQRTTSFCLPRPKQPSSSLDFCFGTTCWPVSSSFLGFCPSLAIFLTVHKIPSSQQLSLLKMESACSFETLSAYRFTQRYKLFSPVSPHGVIQSVVLGLERARASQLDEYNRASPPCISAPAVTAFSYSWHQHAPVTTPAVSN